VAASRGLEAAAAPSALDRHSPWAYQTGCGYIAVDRFHRVVVGSESGSESIWRQVHQGGLFDAAFPIGRAGSASSMVALYSSDAPEELAEASVLCTHEEPRRVVLTPGEGFHSLGLLRSLQSSGFVHLDGRVWSVGGCFGDSWNLCLNVTQLPSARERVTDLHPVPVDDYRDSYRTAIAASPRAAVALATDRFGGSATAIGLPEGRAEPLTLPAEQFATPLGRRPCGPDCKQFVVPPLDSDVRSVPVIVTRIDTVEHREDLAVVLVGMDPSGELARVGTIWRRDSQNYPELSYFLSMYASNLFDTRSVAASGSLWLVAANGELSNDLFLTCIAPDAPGAIVRLAAEGPIGLRASGSDLIVVDARRTRRVACQ